MQPTSEQAGVIAMITPLAWESRVDEMVTRLMIEGATPEIFAELRGIAALATLNGLPECSVLASSLAARLEAEGGGEGQFKDEFTLLRSAMMREQNGIPAQAESIYASLADDAELVADFLVEAREHLSLIEGQMLVLEREPQAMEVIHAVFRAFHTIKGLAGFLGFAVVQAVSHEVETLLDLARNDKLSIDSAIVDVVLESGDFLMAEMVSIDRVLAGSDAQAPADNRALIARIKQLAVAREMTSGLPRTTDMDRSYPSPELPDEQPLFDMADAESVVLKVANEAAQEANVASPLLAAVVTSQSESAAIPAPELPKPSMNSRASEPGKAPDASSVRVDTAKLDHLMDMVGEMVIAQSLIRHSQVLLSANDSRLIGDLSQLTRITAEVQRATMSMRMVPVGQLFQKIERVIRDLSRKAGKLVVLETAGTDTEVDKTVAEELSDPLLHMVRNSVDHGIESASERVTAGKDPAARIRLAAYHQGGQVVIEIADDGRGLNPEKIRTKAEQRNLVSSAAQLTESEIYQLIFEPGFSTAEKITDVSGRGVGMDVVRRNVEKLRGRIETQSVTGQGTTFLLKLPLTLAIIDGLVVEVGRNRYIIPLSVVREIFRPLPETLFSVENRDEMVLVREQLLPIVRLNQRLGVEARAESPSSGLLVVIESESKRFCLLVDDLVGKQEVVIKCLGETFKEVSGFSGCAVLGDGRVGLILDTDGIYRGRRR